VPLQPFVVFAYIAIQLSENTVLITAFQNSTNLELFLKFRTAAACNY
jgi:hypothetical protein